MAFAKITCPVCKEPTVVFTTSDKTTTLFTHGNGDECVQKNEESNEVKSSNL